MIHGAKGTGKTTIMTLAMVSILNIVSTYYRGLRYVVAAMTNEQLRDSFLDTFRAEIPESNYSYNQNAAEIALHFFPGQDCIMRLRYSGDHRGRKTAQKASERRRGSNIHGFYMVQGETLNKQFYDEINSRVVEFPQKMGGVAEAPSPTIRWIDANPSHPRHFLYRHFLNPLDDIFLGNLGMEYNIAATPETSTRYSPAQLEIFRKTWSPHEVARMLDGKWIAAEGQVYRDAQILKEAPDSDQILKLWVGMDPGTAKSEDNGEGNLGLVWIGELKDGTFCVLSDKLAAFSGMDTLKSLILERSAALLNGNMTRFQGVVIDWAGGSGEPIRKWMIGEGVQVNRPTGPDIRSRWFPVMSGVTLLQESYLAGRLTISPNSEGIIKDLGLYVWNSEGQPDKSAYDSHLFDALRYAWIRIGRFL